MDLTAAREAFCIYLKEMDTQTGAGSLGPPPHTIAKNDCSGVSVVYLDADTQTRYDFGSDNELLGVTRLDPQDRRACDQNGRTYGRPCSVREPARLLCPCSFIACAPGVSFQLDGPPSLSSLETARVELCRNDRCAVGTLPRELEIEPGGRHVLFSGSVGVGTTVVLLLSLREGPHLEVMFDVPDAQLHDGDRYRLHLTASDGSVLYDHVEPIAMYDIVGAGEPCTQYCKRKDLDHRSAPEEDAGM